MDARIETADSPGEIATFVSAARSINASFPLWTAPLESQEIQLLTPKKHPFWLTARRQLFLARKNGQVVGRIAAIVDDKYNDYAGLRCGGFGFFECVNDTATAHALLEAAREWLLGEGMTFMRGPLNPSANYTCGLLVHGFEQASGFMMPWNPPYYARLLESWRMRKEQDLFAYLIYKNGMRTPDSLKDEIERLKMEGQFSCRPSSRATMAGDVRAMLEIYRKSWAANWGFSPLSPEEEERHVHDLKSILDPDFFVLFFHGDKPVAGMVALPDLNPLLRRLKGRLGLSAPWHYWRSRKQIRQGYRIMLFGILPEYRLQGLPLLLFDYMMNQAASHPDLQWVEGSWVLEDNYAIDDLIEDFSGVLARRYRIYRREIAAC